MISYQNSWFRCFQKGIIFCNYNEKLKNNAKLKMHVNLNFGTINQSWVANKVISVLLYMINPVVELLYIAGPHCAHFLLYTWFSGFNLIFGTFNGSYPQSHNDYTVPMIFPNNFPFTPSLNTTLLSHNIDLKLDWSVNLSALNLNFSYTVQLHIII